MAPSRGVRIQHVGVRLRKRVSKAGLDARPNPVLRLNGVDEQLKAVRASVDHIQTNLRQIRVHTNMAAMKLLAKKAKIGEIE